MRAIIKIKMRCMSCVKKIETGLGSMQGIDYVGADLEKGEAAVRYDPDLISLDEIRAEVARLGYPADGHKTGVAQGIMYGLVPHIGCIGFIIASILGVTVMMELFKPLLLNRYFFHALIALSVAFATISAAYYLKKNGLLSFAGVRRKWGYLSIMYGSTVGVNLLLFMLVFPLAANMSFGITGAVTALDADSSVKLKVDIPCPGHAPLISQELRKLQGVADVRFSFPDYFDVAYDAGGSSLDDILAIDVFRAYPAIVLSEAGGFLQDAAEPQSCGCGIA